jgi:hypothetical protein
MRDSRKGGRRRVGAGGRVKGRQGRKIDQRLREKRKKERN